MSRKMLRVILASLTLLILFLGLSVPSAQAYIGSNGGTTTLKTDIEMMSGIPVHGGGHVTWKVSGAAARELRAAIILNYDVPRGQEPQNGQLEIDEVERYALDLERYLESEELKHQGANLRRFALLNRDVKADTIGLIHTSNASTDNIEIRFYFDAWVPSGEEEITLSDTLLADAIFVPVNETYVAPGTYKIEHTEYMVNIGDYENVRIKKGDFYLIRTPFGEIYHYSASFKADQNPRDKVKYVPFSWIECPLVLFVVVVVFGYFIVTMPGRYRRHDVMKIVKLHTLAKVLLLIVLLLYFFAAIGGFFVSGVYLWVLCVVFLFVSMVISRTMYENAERITTMPKKPETSQTKTGEKPAAKPSETEDKGRDVQCTTCGEIFHMDEKFSVSSVPCPACGSIGAIELGSIEETQPPDLGPLPSPPPPSSPIEEDEEP